MQKDFAAWVEAHRDEALSFLKEIVEINSFTRNPGGANQVGEVLARFLKGINFSEKRYPNEHFGDHQGFTRSGRGSRLLFLTHKDTVFPPDAGFTDFRIDGKRAFGPGVIDMKGGIVVLLFTLRMLHEMGLGEDHDYAITVVSDEEIGSDDSRKITEELARERDYVLVFECGGRKGELVTSRKGVGTYFIAIEGKAAHAGNEYMEGINANLELAHKLIAIQGLTDVEKGTTVNVGEIRGGTLANTISPSARMVIDLRFEARGEGGRIEKALAGITKQAWVPGTRSVLSGFVQRPVMLETEPTKRFLEIVQEAATSAGQNVEPEHRGGGSDANFTETLGVPTLDGFGPMGGDDHRNTEYMYIDSLFQRIILLATVLTHPKLSVS